MITIVYAVAVRCSCVGLFFGALWGIVAGSQTLQTFHSQPMDAAESNSPRSLPLSHWDNLPDPGEPTRYLEYRHPRQVK
ncbi:MAG: hypothetical protein JWN70_5057 [Planctomycetaceae bacterium]|nr:hypothetical protein [Planctomycetaceae bacterium]